MQATIRKVLNILFTLLILVNQVQTALYNKALSTTAGGTATVTSLTPSATGYEA